MKQERGFTLIEVLVAVSLLAVISILVWQAMGSATGSKERFEKRDAVFRSSTMILDRITRDLEMTALYTNVDLLGVSASGEQMTKSVFIGSNNGDQDKLTFNSYSHVRYLKDTKESDFAEIGYFLEPSEEEEAAGTFVLKKRESSPPDVEPEQGGGAMVLLENVRELNFRYYDNRKEEFVDSWDTTTSDYVNRLPRAVEIVLVMQDPMEEEATIRFSTVVLIEMAPGPSDF